MDFSLRFHGRQIRVHLSADREQYLVEDGEPLEVTVRGTSRVLAPGEKLVLSPSLADDRA